MKSRYIVLLFTTLGLLIPLAFEAAYYLHPFVAGIWLLWIWPSALDLLPQEIDTPNPTLLQVAPVWAISAAINMVLYAAIGGILAGVISLVRRAKTS